MLTGNLIASRAESDESSEITASRRCVSGLKKIMYSPQVLPVVLRTLLGRSDSDPSILATTQSFELL